MAAALALLWTASPALADDIAYISEIGVFTARFCPVGWLPANGALVTIADYDALYSLIGTRFGGDGETVFALPHVEPEQTLTNGSPLISCIATTGIFPSRP